MLITPYPLSVQKLQNRFMQSFLGALSEEVSLRFTLSPILLLSRPSRAAFVAAIKALYKAGCRLIGTDYTLTNDFVPALRAENKHILIAYWAITHHFFDMDVKMMPAVRAMCSFHIRLKLTFQKSCCQKWQMPAHF